MLITEAYVREQLQTIAEQERETKAQIAVLQNTLYLLIGGRQAYEDILSELQKTEEGDHGMDGTNDVG